MHVCVMLYSCMPDWYNYLIREKLDFEHQNCTQSTSLESTWITGMFQKNFNIVHGPYWMGYWPRFLEGWRWLNILRLHLQKDWFMTCTFSKLTPCGEKKQKNTRLAWRTQKQCDCDWCFLFQNFTPSPQKLGCKFFFCFLSKGHPHNLGVRGQRYLSI